MTGLEKTDEGVANILEIVRLGRAERAKKVETICREHGIVSTGYVAQALGLRVEDTESMLRNMKGIQSVGITRDGTLWRLKSTPEDPFKGATQFLKGISP